MTYLIYDNYFIASFTPYLVEDAIRAFGDDNYPSFREVFAEHQQITKIKQDEGNLYLNYEGFIKVSQAFATNDLDKNFLTSAFLDLNIENSHISLSGFSFADSSKALQMIKGVIGAPLDMSDVISNRTSMLHHFSFQDPYLWRNQQKNTDHLNQKTFRSERSINPQDAMKFLDQEMGRAIQFRDGHLISFRTFCKNVSTAAATMS